DGADANRHGVPPGMSVCYCKYKVYDSKPRASRNPWPEKHDEGGRPADEPVGLPPSIGPGGRGRPDQPATTSRATVACTSGCRRTSAWAGPTFLIGVGISMVRRSTSGPPPVLIASATSWLVTAPKRRPLSPAWALTVTVSASRLPLRDCASSRDFAARAARPAAIASTCFCAPFVHCVARPRR